AKAGAARRPADRGLPDAARTGEHRQQPREPHDVSAPAQPDRTRTSHGPWRLFWRGNRPAVGPRRGERALHADRGGRLCADVRSAALLSHYAARRFAWISLRLIRHSAIWTALSAAPLRRLSDTTHICNPLSIVASSRIRLM